MRERSDDARGRIDLSVPQVAGSALAAVIAAKLASSFGVYGTILGAGVVSIVATCGGTLFQHFFRRTGEQLKERRTAEQPRVTVAAAGAATATGTRVAPGPGEFGEGTVYRARVKSWKRPLIAAAVVFGVTMGGITTYELVSGHNLSGGGSTTVRDALSGHSGSSSGSDDSGTDTGDTDGGDSSPSADPDGSAGSGSDAGSPTATPSGSAGTGEDGTSSDDGTAEDSTGSEEGGTSATPTPTPSTGDGQDTGATADPGESATTPGSSADGRSGTGDQDQDDPAAP
ncbi:hypothetical protein [Streptomyces sp. CRN 30]|uniref:hypothetical protein n=1 Tax=Streptomyces sp. CRN 30 TaxID=3075613 RepID=UPI002A815CF3|nr:hypothetical protein [Streptomyces sp. CRN 30]